MKTLPLWLCLCATQAPAQTITLRPELLAYARAHRQDAALRPAFERLLRDAHAALQAEPVAVTDKHTLLPPTNDPHDYFSLSPYWWPDSTRPNGLPYVRRDGETNPESKRDLDQPRVAALGDRLQTLALAYYLTGAEHYAQAAARQLRTWFLDPATRMNPQLRFAQLVRGNPNERGSGIIDTRWFIEVVDAVGLLQGSQSWTAADQRALRQWFQAYQQWLLTSPNGAHERAAKNNHGSWYAAQTAAYALFIGDTATARGIIEGVKARIGAQFDAAGMQAEEMVRTRSLHYSNFNIEALSRVAEMGRGMGVDLWSYTAPNGASLAQGARLVAKFAGREREWPGPQISGVESPLLLSTLRRALVARPDTTFANAIARVPPDVAKADRSTLLFPPSSAPPAAHPGIFLTREEGVAIKAALGKYPLLDRSFEEARAMVEHALANPIAVPPPGEAGGYEHERHKQNYRELQAAGELYTITGDERYARFVSRLLEEYAVLYPTLGAHPLAKNQAPGKLFHQSLNEANWLVATSIAYDCVHDFLTAEQRTRYEQNILRPMADWLSVTQAGEFDRIHNHGTWATAAVGMLGLVLNDSGYVNRALYGTKRDRSGGFLRQLDLLFSPDGYYLEGPYYIRYALMPFFFFAEAIERGRPELGIYRYRDQILRKALYSAVGTAYPNGVLPPINDASRTMAITAPEVVLAVDAAYARYGANDNLLGAAAIQDLVVLNGAGLAVARDLAAHQPPPALSFGSLEFTDGFDGERGGLGILRAGEGGDATMLLMKYGVHGQGHGHFDKLHFVLFDGGREVVPDYGFSRWINIEPKSGGRYLPENDSYAMQTIAHNTVAVDQATQSGGNEAADEARWGERHFFDAHDPRVQVMSARARGFYPGVDQQRTMLLLRDARLPYPVVLDLFRLTSAAPHTYDYPLHFRGQLIATSVPYQANPTAQHPLGTAHGYQHIWEEARGATDSTFRFTWLDGSRYHTLTAAATPGTEVIFGRTGASDPNFNLVSEPLLLLRRQQGNALFAAVLEPHGFFSEAQERSQEARGRIQDVRVLAAEPEATVVDVTGARGLHWIVMVTNGPASDRAVHRVTAGGRTYQWTGNYSVEGVQ